MTSILPLAPCKAGRAYDAARMRAIGDLTERLPRLPVVDEDLRVGPDAGELVAGRRVAHVLDELRVCLDALQNAPYA